MTPTISSSLLARIAFYAAMVAIIAIHLGLIAYFSYPAISFDREPINLGDFDGHIGQTWHIIEGIEGWGKTWVYDPHLVAGYPVGTISDANNKAWELLTWALWKLGLTKGAAHNAFLLLAHLIVLPAVYFSARLFRLKKWSSLVAMAMGSALWFFDSYAHWLWFVGMVSYAMVCSITLLALALFYRYLEDRRLWQVILAAFCVGITHLVHAWGFIILVVPMAILYIRAFKQLGRRDHAAIATIPIITLAINSYWLIVAFEFMRYILDSGYYGKASFAFFIADFFGLLLDTSTNGPIGNRTGFRFLFLAATIVMLVVWKRSGDKRFVMFATGIGYLLTIAYLGANFKVLTQIQPYRNILPAAFLTLIPAAALVEKLWHNRASYRPHGFVSAAIVVLSIPGVQHLSSDVLYYFPDELPKVGVNEEGLPINLAASGYAPHYTYRHTVKSMIDDGLAEWVKRNNDGKSRFLVQFGLMGEHLIWKTDAEIIGGFPFRNLSHTYANIFRPRDDINYLSKKDIQIYLDTFAIKWVIVDYPDPRYMYALTLLEYHETVGRHHILRTKINPSLFQVGSGNITSSTNRIEVRDTDPNQEIVLRYNWLHTLVCEPRCSVESAPNRYSPVGFIRIPAPHPRDFVILNGY